MTPCKEIMGKIASRDTGWLRSVAHINACDDGGVTVQVEDYQVCVEDPNDVEYLLRVLDTTEYVWAMWPYEVECGFFSDFIKVDEESLINKEYDPDEVCYNRVRIEKERAERLGLPVVKGGGTWS